MVLLDQQSTSQERKSNTSENILLYTRHGFETLGMIQWIRCHLLYDTPGELVQTVTLAIIC